MSVSHSYSIALLPCRCGGKARFQVVKGDAYHDVNVGGHYIDCEGCGLSTKLVFPLKDDVSRELAKRELAEKWNKRGSGPNSYCAALAKIAAGDYDDLAGDPGKWSATFAYEALGGKYINGQRVDLVSALLARCSGPNSYSNAEVEALSLELSQARQDMEAMVARIFNLEKSLERGSGPNDEGISANEMLIVRGALAYIKHVGSNFTARGKEHPQKWLVDGLTTLLNRLSGTTATLQRFQEDK